MSFNYGDVRIGFVHTDCFRTLTEVSLKFVNTLQRTGDADLRF